MKRKAKTARGSRQALAIFFAFILSFGLLSVPPAYAMEAAQDAVEESVVLDRLDPLQYQGNPDIELITNEAIGDAINTDYINSEDAMFTIDETETFIAIVELKAEPLGESAALLNSNDTMSRVSAASVRIRQNAMLSEQKEVVNTLKSTNENVEIIYNYTAVINGFSAEITAKDVAALKADPRVSAVYVSQTYEVPEPQDSSSTGMVWAPNAWARGFKGDGMLIAIIDTGVDYNHPLLSTLDSAKKLTQADMQTRISNAGNLSATLGSYYKNDKVAFGYDYADKDEDPMDVNGHGTHVAGISAANVGDEGVVLGVAQNAQLMAMKVFSSFDLLGASDSAILAALDDAVKLGADAINLSLGSAAGFSAIEGAGELSYEKIFARARAAGNGVAVAAGNDTTMGTESYVSGLLGIELPYATNPEFGLVASPSTYSSSLSVASFDNNSMYTAYFKMGDKSYPFVDTNSAPFNSTFNGKTFEYVPVPGTGAASDYDGLNVTGKIALVQRGTLSFTEKVQNAQNKGAVAVIVYNHSDGYTNMELDDSMIPAVFISLNDGLELVAAGTGNLNFSEDYFMYFANGTAGQLSQFSSWGTTPDLKIKPDISAPGGSIYSTYPVSKGSYTLNGGTSMASPHVAAGYTLVKQYLKQHSDSLAAFRQLTPEMLAKRVDNMLMGTAQIMKDPGGIPYPVHAQGAGLMNLNLATTTKTFLYNTYDGKTKVELGDNVNHSSFTVDFKILNYSNSPVYCYLNANDTILMADSYTNYDDLYFDALSSTVLGKASQIRVNGNVNTTGYFQVAAQAEISISVTFSVSEADHEKLSAVYTNGYFVDGFVSVRQSTNDTTPLSIPFLGFVGDWQQAPAFDSLSIYEGVNNLADVPFYWDNLLLGNYGTWTSWMPLGMNTRTGDIAPSTDFLAFSPNGDGYYDYLTGYIYLLRNLRNMRMEITDSQGNVVTTKSADYFTKSFYHSSAGSIRSYLLAGYDLYWDGRDDNYQKMPDGMYTFTLYGTLDYGETSTKEVCWSLDVLLDTEAPTVEYEVREESGQYFVTITAKDNHQLQSLLIGEGTSVINGKALMGFNEYTIEYEITNYVNAYGLNGALRKLTIQADDYAQNAYFEFMLEPEPIINMNISVKDLNFVEGLPFVLEFDVTGTNVEYLADHKITAYLGDGGSGRYTEDIVLPINKTGSYRVLFDNMPTSSFIMLHVLKDGAQYITIRLFSRPLPANMWNPTVTKTADGKISVGFASSLGSVSGATVNGIAADTSITGANLKIDAPYEDGAEIKLTGVSFKLASVYTVQYFTAYTFSFNLFCQGGATQAYSWLETTPMSAARVVQFTNNIVDEDVVNRILSTVTGDFIAELTGSVQEVGDMAFYGRNKNADGNLISVTVASSVVRFGDEVFYGCSNLAEITFAGTSRIMLGNTMFNGVKNVTLYAKGDLYAQLAENYVSSSNVNVVEISQYTINPTAIPSDGGTVSGGGIFDQGASVTLTAAAQKGYEFVGWYANASSDTPASANSVWTFAADGTITNPVARFERTALPAVHVIFTADKGNTLTAAGVKAQISDFEGDFIAEFDGSVKYIDNYAFAMNDRLVGVITGDNVKEIGGLAFIGCDWLIDAAIGNGVTRIGDLAFFHSGRLAKVTIGNSVNTIGRDAFTACSKLNGVTFNGADIINFSDYTFDFINNVTLYARGALYNQLSESYKDNSKINVVELGGIETHTVSVEASPVEGGYVEISNNGVVNDGESVTLTAAPNEGYVFDGWYENDAPLTGLGVGDVYTDKNVTLLNITSDRYLVAKFTLEITNPSYVITVTATAGGEATGSGVYEEGSSATLVASPDPDFAFEGWYENDEPLTGLADGEKYTDECVTLVNVTSDRHIVAKFAEISKPVSIKDVEIVFLTPGIVTLTKGKTYQLEIQTDPYLNLYEWPYSVTWKSLTPTITSVNTTGLVTGKSVGTGLVQAIIKDLYGNEVVVTYTIIVK